MAVVGCGNISKQYLKNLATFPDVQVLFCADIDAGRAKAQAAAYGVPASGSPEQALEHPDVQLVVNLTIPAAHAEVASAAIAAGKHVWNEKPLAPDVAAGRALLDQARAAGVRVGCAPDTVLGAGIQSARRLIAAGAIGTPISALTLLQGPGPESWHPDPEFLFAKGAGPLFDLGPYYLSVLATLFGPATRVAAVGRRDRDTRVIGSGPRAGTEFAVEVPTYMSALAQYAGGQAASLLFSWDSPLSRSGFVEITGTEATLAVPDPNQVRRRPAGAPGGRPGVDRDRRARGGGGARQRRGRHGPGDPPGPAAPGLGRDGAARARADDRDRAVRRHARASSRSSRSSTCPRRSRRTGIPMSQPPSLGVGMVGYAFMGRAHSQAWRTVDRVFELPLRPRLAAICGRDEAAAESAAARLGWAATETDWRALIARDDVQLIDIAAPGSLHAPIAIAALQAGKHVLCEKPLANTLAEAERMAAAADAAFPSGARAMVGFNYRRVPALALARRLVEQGRIGPLRHVRAVYLQDWLVDPDSPLTWRMQADRAGSGALGDLGAHIVDLARFLTGDEITGVSAVSATFVEAASAAPATRAPAGSRSTTRWSSARGSDPARWGRSRRPGTPPAARTGSGSSSTARPAASRSTSSGSTSSSSTTATTPTAARPPGSAGSWSPSRNIPTSPAGGRPVTPSAGSTRSPTRPGTC